MKATFAKWCETAAGFVPRSRRSAVFSELYGHLEDHAAALREQGMDEAAADAGAMQAMGDPEEVGRQLRRAEWTPAGMFRLVRDAIIGSRWVAWYNGTDEKRYRALCEALTLAQIPYRAEQQDELFRTNAASVVPGRLNTDNSMRRDGAWNPNMGIAASSVVRDHLPNRYIICLQRRDLPAARRLGV